MVTKQGRKRTQICIKYNKRGTFRERQREGEEREREKEEIERKEREVEDTLIETCFEMLKSLEHEKLSHWQ